VSIIATALRHLMAAGVTGEALLRAVEDMEAAQQPSRSKGAERQAAYVARKRAEEEAGNVTNDVTDVTSVTLRQETEVSPKKQQSIPPSHSPPICPPFPVAAALAVWNEMGERTGLPKALTATGKRQAGIKARLAEHGEAGWREAVAAVERSPFCRGENDRGWRADIGFLIRPDNFAKLREGGFDPKSNGKPLVGKAGSAPMTAQQIRSAIAFAEDNQDPERASELRRQLERLQSRAPPSDPAIAGLVGRTTDKLRSVAGHH
jgi:hypothetical protein